MRTWMEALRAWNANKSVWCIPKKGTKAYNEVRAIMDGAPARRPSARDSPEEARPRRRRLRRLADM